MCIFFLSLLRHAVANTGPLCNTEITIMYPNFPTKTVKYWRRSQVYGDREQSSHFHYFFVYFFILFLFPILETKQIIRNEIIVMIKILIKGLIKSEKKKIETKIKPKLNFFTWPVTTTEIIKCSCCSDHLYFILFNISLQRILKIQTVEKSSTKH